MPSDSFTIKEYLKDMDKRLNDRIDHIETKMDTNTDKITSRQDKTNGRVKALELWRSALVGGVSIITVLGLPNVIQVLANNV